MPFTFYVNSNLFLDHFESAWESVSSNKSSGIGGTDYWKSGKSSNFTIALEEKM